MRRALQRFVSKLNGRNKYLFFMIIILVCVVALSLGIYAQFFYKYAETDPLMIGIHTNPQKTQEEYDLLRSQFNDLFDNSLKINSESVKVSKLENGKEVVYTAYDLKNEDELYSVDAAIPIININTEEIKKINSEIKNEYYNKANEVMRQTQGNTVYKVSYVAYINSDVLSIAIRASLKEEGKSEKVSIRTYTYSMGREEMVSLADLITLKKTTADDVQKNINTEIKKAYENAKIIATEYGNLYERDLSSDLYKVENSKDFFLTDDGYVYIIYPYGNEEDTNEMDIVIF